MLYNPITQKRRTDKEGKQHPWRVWGLKQSSQPGRHCTMGRDKNAPHNMYIRAVAVQQTGLIPVQFRRETHKSELVHPFACRYTYTWNRDPAYKRWNGEGPLRRSMKPPPVAEGEEEEEEDYTSE